MANSEVPSAHTWKRSVTPTSTGAQQSVKRARLDEPEVPIVSDAQAGPSSVWNADNDDVPMNDARTGQSPKKARPKKFKRPPPPEPGSSEDVILHDVMSLLGAEQVASAMKNKSDYTSPLEKGQEIELVVSELSSNGESLSLLPSSPTPWVVLVPFALPGETIRARVYANARFHSLADLVSVVTPNQALRDMGRVKCRYFGACAGCQYQMLSYDTQLELKRKVVEKAYNHFSGLPAHLLPSILPTIPSPKTYGYRTKITPHFDIAPNSRGRRRGKDAKDDHKDVTAAKPFDLTIGFGEKGRRRVIDIEECVIATPVLNKALTPAREMVQRNINTYKRGATLLLRDSLKRPDSSPANASTSTGPVDLALEQITNPPAPPSTETRSNELSEPVVVPSATMPLPGEEEEHICITDHKATVRESVGDTIFEFPAGSFFQNNNSVLPSLVDYVRNAIFASTSSEAEAVRPTHLVDTYCGSGLFAISLAPAFIHVAGVEISADSIASARQNARLNNLPPASSSSSSSINKSIVFTAGKSESIFATVSHFPPTHTVVIIDPPRKGCDKPFLQQLVTFRPAKLVYVSCNVHTQARDVGDLLRMMEQAGKDDAGVRRQTYVIESLRGLDLFPQTSHVESVAVLCLRDVEG
ncbi:tRNA(m5U54)methyltransferase [Tulasnella sp. 331]|nr:tRNA(m5U54)methyltransferase [Tulasnella sp. 331]